MSKKQELARNALILTFGKICTQFVSFLLLPLYTALLLPEEYGIVDLFNTYITLLVPLFNWQFENGLFRFMLDCRGEHKKQKELFSTVLTTNFVQIFIYLIVFFIASPYIHSEYKIFLALDVAVNIVMNTLLQFPRGLGKNGIYSFASFLAAASTVGLNVVFIAGFRWGAYGLFIATLLAKIITCIYLAIATKIWKYYAIVSVSKRTFKEVFSYSLPLVPNNLSWWIVGVSDRTIVSKAISITANGIYSVANKFSSVYITFYNVFNLSWTESVALHLFDDDGEEFIEDTLNTLFKIFSCICLFMISCMPFVFPLMVNANYNDAYYQIPILLIAVLFQVIVGLYSAIYVALKKSVEIAKTSFGAAVINVLINVILIKVIGLYAASLSTLVAYAVMAIYRYFDLKKYVTVILNKTVVLWTIFIFIVNTVTYYVNSFLINCVMLFVVIIYSLIMNKSFIVSVYYSLTAKLKNNKKNGGK